MSNCARASLGFSVRLSAANPDSPSQPSQHNPNSEQVAVFKMALEGGVHATATGAAETEIQSWYTSTTDLAVAASGRGDDFTKKWAEWTMGTKIAIQENCDA